MELSHPHCACKRLKHCLRFGVAWLRPDSQLVAPNLPSCHVKACADISQHDIFSIWSVCYTCAPKDLGRLTRFTRGPSSLYFQFQAWDSQFWPWQQWLSCTRRVQVLGPNEPGRFGAGVLFKFGVDSLVMFLQLSPFIERGNFTPIFVYDSSKDSWCAVLCADSCSHFCALFCSDNFKFGSQIFAKMFALIFHWFIFDVLVLKNCSKKTKKSHSHHRPDFWNNFWEVVGSLERFLRSCARMRHLWGFPTLWPKGLLAFASRYFQTKVCEILLCEPFASGDLTGFFRFPPRPLLQFSPVLGDFPKSAQNRPQIGLNLASNWHGTCNFGPIRGQLVVSRWILKNTCFQSVNKGLHYHPVLD